MEFSGVAPPDTSDITSNTKFTAHFNRPSAQRQSRTHDLCLHRQTGRSPCRQAPDVRVKINEEYARHVGAVLLLRARANEVIDER